MNTNSTNKPVVRTKLLGGAAALALTGAFFAGGLVAPTQTALAEAVRIEAPQVVNFADVVQAVTPAVVSVRVKGQSRAGDRRSRRGGPFGFDNLPKDHPFRRFFEDRNGDQRQFGQRRDRREFRRDDRRKPKNRGISQGSGFFVSEDGYIVTNYHVVKGGNSFQIVMDNGDELDAKLVGKDEKTDLAVLKVEDKRKFKYVGFSKTKSRKGEWVVAVGNPFGLGGSVSAGIISASGRDIGSGPYDDYIQIDAAVNKGNSGGPTFNLSGEVIGVNTAIFSPSGGNVGIAFAITAATAGEVVDDLIKNGSVTRGWLGVQIQPVSKDIAESLALSEANGAIVAEAQKDSPAANAGIETGDVIVSVDGKKVKNPKVLARMIASLEPDQTVAIAVVRDGKEQMIDVKLGTLPGAPKQAALKDDDRSDTDDADVEVVDLEQFGFSIAAIDGGVVVEEVSEDGAARDKGFRPGDRIVSVNGRETASVRDVGQAVARAMEDERKAVLFQIKSGNRSRFVALPVDKG